MNDPDVCWHCRAVLLPEPAPHCDQCPPVGECDIVGCGEPGCTEHLDAEALEILRRCRGDVEDREALHRAHRLLRRVIHDPNDLGALKRLARDIRIELEQNGALDEPGAQN
jgi:hypothetical protein